MNAKKLTALLSALVMTISFAACTGSGDDAQSSNGSTESTNAPADTQNSSEQEVDPVERDAANAAAKVVYDTINTASADWLAVGEELNMIPRGFQSPLAVRELDPENPIHKAVMTAMEANGTADGVVAWEIGEDYKAVKAQWAKTYESFMGQYPEPTEDESSNAAPDDSSEPAPEETT